MKMIVANIGFHPLSKKITLFVGSILLINIVNAHKCYVCGPNNTDANIQNNGDFISTCDRFDPSNPIFVRECLLHSKGCSIQTNGTEVRRTCEPLTLVDCKKANNVEYCYCNTNLCNKFHPTHADDEEDFEGSGTERQPVTDVVNVLQVPNVVSTPASTSSAAHLVNNTLLMFFVVLVVVSCDKYFL